jgi:hypothetical protein
VCVWVCVIHHSLCVCVCIPQRPSLPPPHRTQVAVGGSALYRVVLRDALGEAFDGVDDAA